jgi:uncharacterized protein (TIGR04255 family)
MCVVKCEVMNPPQTPFTDEEVAEIHLKNAPLALAVAQVRYPVIATLANQEFIAPFQERLRSQYPIMRQERQVAMAIGPGGPTTQEHGTVWRLQEQIPGWSVALAPDFLAIETSAYTDRDDFLSRWTEVLGALESLVNPAVYERLGVRYVNRLTGVEATDQLPTFVRDEILGALTIELPESGKVVASATQIHFQLDELQMQARWGRVPENSVLLPGIAPISEISWLLDIDVFSEGMKPFAVDGVVTSSRTQADHAYRFFRWAVTEEFLRRFGGEL